MKATKELMRSVRLFDRATVKSGKSIYEGPIYMISERGINVGTGIGVYFFKWEHVITTKTHEEYYSLKQLKDTEN